MRDSRTSSRRWGAWAHIAAPLGVVLGLGLLAVPAHADCGGVVHAAPRHINPGHRPPLAIGDSTMLLAVRPLARAGFEADARGCRPMVEGLELIARRRRQHRLSKVVLVHLGGNAGLTPAHISRALRIMGPRRILVLVIPRPREARLIRAAARRYPRRIRVLDWAREWQAHRAYLSDHGLHLTDTGVAAFVRLCRPALRLNRGR